MRIFIFLSICFFTAILSSHAQILRETIIETEEEIISMDIVLDHSGISHVFYVWHEFDREEDGQWFYDWYIMHSQNGSGEFSEPECIYMSNERAVYGGIWSLSADIDSEDKFHLSFIDTWGLAANGGLMYLNNLSDEWIEPELISTIWDCAALVVDHNDHIQIAHYYVMSGETNTLKYVTNSGGTWSGEDVVDLSKLCEGAIIDIDIDRDNNPHISYTKYRFQKYNTMYTYKTNGSWYTDNNNRILGDEHPLRSTCHSDRPTRFATYQLLHPGRF